MTVYLPTIPQGTSNLSTSQGQMLVNFGQLNTQFGVDHTPYNNSGVNGDGFHKKITFNAPLADPSPAGTQAVEYMKTISGAGEPFLANSNGHGVMWYGGTGSGSASIANIGSGQTGTGTAGTNGFMTLPNGITMQWGVYQQINGSVAVTFPFTFPNATLSVVTNWLRISTPNGFVWTTNITAGGFTSNGNDGTHNAIYFAIGF